MHCRFHLAKGIRADETDCLGSLGQMHGDEVGLSQELVESDHSNPELCCASRLNVRVEGNQLHTEGREALRNQYPNTTKTDDAHSLVRDLDAGVLGALPLTPVQSRIGRHDVAGAGQEQTDGQFRGAHDIRGRGVHDHDAGLGCRLNIHVVQSDTRTRDDLQALGSGYRLRVDLGRRTHQDCVNIGDGGQQFVSVSTVTLDDLEIRPEGVHGRRGQFFGDQHAGFGHRPILAACRGSAVSGDRRVTWTKR